ncbi:hypothetical protein EMPS_06639 [Entomortierella parvispora]|uniref:Uncharacterized protein n=1 Tax=Entomortierella parvispora TaxID=205924 RepID=A0A9P3HCW3_9FUNG|nr:hypothetical protein EMPS_06639 [Entomortierella parvispora]
MAPWSRAVVPETASTSSAAAAAAAAAPPLLQPRRSHTPSSAAQPQSQTQNQVVRSLAPSTHTALRHSTSNTSLSATYPSKDATEVTVSLSDAEDKDKTPTAVHRNIGDNTPRPSHQKILSHKSSTDTLKAEAATSSTTSSSKANLGSITAPTTHRGHGPSEGRSRNRRQEHVSSSTTSPPQRRRSGHRSAQPSSLQQTTPARSNSTSKKFSLRSKKKRQEREDQEREERRLKEEADEAIRRKHGEYHPPGQSQGQIHTHRLPRHQDQHEVERQRSFTSLRQQYQYQQRHNSGSSSRVVSPTPGSKSPPSVEDLRLYYQQQHQHDRDRDRARDRSRHSSRSSSSYSSRQGSRGTSPEASAAVRYGHHHQHAVASTVANGLSLNDLDPEGILSEYWETQSEQDDPDLDAFGPLRGDHRRDGNSLDQERKSSMDTNSSYQSNPSSMSNGNSSRQSRQSQTAVDARSYHSHGGVGLGNNLLYPSHFALQQQHLQEQLQKTPIQQPAPTHQSRTDSRLSSHRGLRALEMGELKPQHQSWPLNNASQTGIVTGLDPAIEVSNPSGSSHHQHQQNRLHGSISGTFRPGSSQSQNHYQSAQRSRDNMVERYLYHARANSPSNSNVASSSNHRSSSSNNHHPHLYHLDHPHHPRSTSAFGHHTSIDMAAVEALRAKAGSRASRMNGSSTIHTGSGTNTAVATSPNAGMFNKEIDETMELPDEHNYLAPLPPFQQGPAYTRVPKRMFCQWFCGGCRWWVLLLLVFILLVAAAIVFVSLKHYWPSWL